jgi:hypothetical protein
MTTAKQEYYVRQAITRLGVGFIRKMKAAKATIHEMKKIADGHGECCPSCEIPKIADYLEGVEANLGWYLDQLHESSGK